MISCPSCQSQNPETAAFCSQCGHRLAVGRASPRASTVFLQPESGQLTHRLVLLRPGGVEGGSFTMGQGKLICGRGEVSLHLEDPFLNPRHAEFVLRDETVVVVDLQSTNGVFLRLRAETPLRPADEIRLGRQLLRFDQLPQPQGTPDGGRTWGSPSRAMRYRVVQMLEGSGTGDALPMSDGEYLFGREEGGMTFPADPAVSRRHAVLSIAGDRCLLRDLESANGTFLRVRREAQLHPGDQLLLGTQQLRYERSTG
jgi:pSer/pThr/pTyr-binding forkhead associated (FHA) protein